MSPKSAPKSAPPKSTAPANSAPRPKEGRKKEIRADFLLGFQRPPSYQRPQNAGYAPPPRRSGPPSGTRRAPASFGRGRFVQSNFRILVDEVTPDVVEATLNADALLDWNSVRRVDLQGDTRLKCPICLEEDLVVPKITRCGHVFCAACIMRYFLALQEYNGKFMQKCPVCNTQQISPEESMSVRLELSKPPREGERLRFILARRAASSTVVRPPPGIAVGGGVAAVCRDEGHPWSLPVEGQPGAHFSRLVRLPPGRYFHQLTEEMDALTAFRVASLSTGDTELFPSIDATVKLLENQRSQLGEEAEHLYGHLELPAAAAAEEEVEEWAREDEETCESRSAAASSSSARQSPAPGTPVDVGMPKSPGARGSPGLTSSSPGLGASAPAMPVPEGAGPRNHLISFYQADDGRPIYLQPFFTKLLLHEHECAWENLPKELPLVRIEKVHAVSVNEETRRRHKFLSHMPLGSQISMTDIDLRGIISKETKELFAADFEKLREQRKKDIQKSRREDRLSKNRAEAEEDKYYASLNRENPRDFVPQVVPTKEDFVPLPGSRAALAEEAGEDRGDEDAEAEPQGPTLAMMLKERMAGRGRGRGRAAKAPAALPPDAAAWGPALAESSRSAASSGSGAWGRGKGGGKVAAGRKGGSAAAASGASAAAAEEPAEPQVIPDNWDSEDEQPTFGAALDAALRKATASSPEVAAAPEASEVAGEGAEQAGGGGDTAAAAPSAGGGGKKKKGKAKVTTIRLFG